MTYRVRRVYHMDDYEDILTELHKEVFAGNAPLPDFEEGDWWIVWFDKEPVGFTGLCAGRTPGWGYLIRVGILPTHRGQGLYKRLNEVRERRAKKYGWVRLVTDTRYPSVANKLAQAGYKLYEPEQPWAFEQSYYMFKDLK